MTKSNTSHGKKNNAKNNQRDLSSDNVDATAEAKSDGLPEGDTPLPTDKQSKELLVSDLCKTFGPFAMILVSSFCLLFFIMFILF